MEEKKPLEEEEFPAGSVIFGGLVLGRATKIETLDKEKTLQAMGKMHSVFLTVGLVLAAVIIFLRIVWSDDNAR